MRGSDNPYSSPIACSLWLALFLGVVPPATAMVRQSRVSPPSDLTALSLEELMETEVVVTSVAKKASRLSDSAAAVFVLTREDLRRSGATSIPEALRLVPGLDVARVDANQWAISARGFNVQFSGKLLVLIDGRTVYNPLFAGVYWNAQETLLEDVDRVEVIRGPGATLWGSNAVNGVINITTRSARETHGSLFSVTAGEEERGILSLRQGGVIGTTHYRAWGNAFQRDRFYAPGGGEANDDWQEGRGGFRLDGDHGPRETWTFEGEAYHGDAGGTIQEVARTPPFSTHSTLSHSIWIEDVEWLT